MAATVGSFVLKSRRTGRVRTLSIYNAAAGAAGTYVLADWNVPAAATSPNSFSVPEQMQVIDFIPTAANGQIEFTVDGVRSGLVLDYALFPAAAGLGGRPLGTLPLLGPGKQYRLLVVIALAA